MGLNVQSTGGSLEVPVANVAASSNTSTTLYTVPSGRYFKGWVGCTSGQYGMKIGDATIMKNDSSNSIPQPQGINITLFAGQTVGRGSTSTSYGTAWVVGVEYNI